MSNPFRVTDRAWKRLCFLVPKKFVTINKGSTGTHTRCIVFERYRHVRFKFDLYAHRFDFVYEVLLGIYTFEHLKRRLGAVFVQGFVA